MNSVANRACPGCRALVSSNAKTCPSCRLDFEHFVDCARPARIEPPSGAFAVDAVREAIADRSETYDRARVVRSILERCEQELLALQCIAHLTADDVNELGAAKGFTGRAILALGRMPL